MKVKPIILHVIPADREINLLSLTNLGCVASLYRVQSALKVNILTQYMLCIIFTCVYVE